MEVEARSSGLLFEGQLAQKVQDGTKTMTTRVWTVASFNSLLKAVNAKALVPFKTTYDNTFGFGFI